MVDTAPDVPKPATAATRAAHARTVASAPPDDRTDFVRAERGRLTPRPDTPITHLAFGHDLWTFDAWDFLDGSPPDTVHPTLWRQGQLNAIAGLFEVADGIYQVRGFDLSNITFVAGDTGWIVIDPLTSTETARGALEVVTAHLGARPIHTVIYTHSHIDHFAGVRGVVDEADVASGRVEIIAPEGFLHAAVSENVIAGPAMTRRAMYMYGALLPRHAQGHVGCGLGQAVPALGTASLIAPTTDIRATGEERTIDGVRIVFQVTPGTEAPAEMNFMFPDHRALCMAENCTATLHNLYTLRGAEVRNALTWSKYIDESIELFAADADVLFASHHWPRWGVDDLTDFLRQQRDLYRYLHDQTMRLANHGQTMSEIAEELTLPPGLEDEFHAHGYYGTISHNAKAVYQRYLGWFDGNPAHLDQLPPVEAGRRYVAAMGGPEALLRTARASFDAGDYRWVVELVNHLVFADPDNEAARLLQADALEQLGYQAESGPWRNFYLTGAQELRRYAPPFDLPSTPSAHLTAAMTTELVLDYTGVRLDGPAATGVELRLNLTITDRDERWALGVSHGALHATPGRHHEHPAVTTVVTEHAGLTALLMEGRPLAELRADDLVHVDGDPAALETLLGLLDRWSLLFPIVTP